MVQAEWSNAVSDALREAIMRLLPSKPVALLEKTTAHGFRDCDVKEQVLIMLNDEEIELTSDRTLRSTANDRS